MEEPINNITRFIFFVQLGPKLPRYYFQLSKILSEYQVQLVPVEIGQLRELSQNKQNMIVICADTCMTTRAEMKKAMRSTLGVMLRFKQISLFHISSFEKDVNLVPFEKSKAYQFVRLPENYEIICQKICYFLAENLKVINKWPGGRRAKLPAA